MAWGDYCVVDGGWETARFSFEKAAACANKRIAEGSDPAWVYVKNVVTGKAVPDASWREPSMTILARAREAGS
jgi:hypothetical protein